MLEAVSRARAAVARSRAGCVEGPNLDFDKDAAVANLRAVKRGIPVFEISARTGTGFEPWIEWIEAKVPNKRKGDPAANNEITRKSCWL